MADFARLERRLQQAVERFERVEARLGAATDGAEIVRLGQEHAELKPLVEAIAALHAARAEMATLENMLKEGGDAELNALARTEIQTIRERIPGMEHAALVLLAPKDKDESASAILEVRAGAGGEEAALFAGDLLRMYQRYAGTRGWRFELESLSDTGLGGVKEAVASVTGNGVFGRLKYESGVHRVQRVPETEAGGRIHTSAATVAVLPQPDEVDIVIEDKDLRIDTMRASGAGGQHVNKTDSAVRITHIPSGIVVLSTEKSQHQNRARAMKMLQAKLYDAERERLASARAADRKVQVGSGDRSERIRTYNFPQGRVTDHRINLTVYNLPEVIDGGGLDPIVDALAAEEQARRLAALEDEA
jgi:peptide chain release factor 1